MSESQRTVRTVSEVRATVRAIVLELSPDRPDDAPPEARLIPDLGYHSLALTELAFTLEDEFDLDPIEEGTARRISTLGAVQEHVVGELTGRGEIASEP